MFGIKSIRVGEGVRSDIDLMARETPAYPASQREFKARQGFHDNRINVLLMKSRISNQVFVGVSLRVFFKRIQVLAILEWRIIQRLIEKSARSIVVNNLHPIAPRPRS